ncbi:MAG: hypothetical protein CSB16_00725 [Clostridiales bacterium]|nr:MAG: hypothetical protein CSB16_00725 [Clostridiales bacterium]
MPRPKKNPLIRQKEFIDAAKELFSSKGYIKTSIQDIMAKVGKNSCSPSVFYYYFKSKGDIYQKVMEDYMDNYISEFESYLGNKNLMFEEKMFHLLRIFTNTILKSKNIMFKSKSLKNRVFLLDLKNRIVIKNIKLWDKIITDLPWTLNIDTKAASTYIVGGIAEIAYIFVFGTELKNNKKIFIQSINDLVSNTLNMPKQTRYILTKKVRRLYDG